VTTAADAAAHGEGGAAGRPRRGRPKKQVTDAGAPGLSIENPTESLPESARSILAAARTVLAERGFEGLTIEAVANQANVSRTLVPYHFGSRAGLVAILIDSLFHDAAVGIWRRQASGSGCGSLPDFLEMVRLEAEDVRGQKDFFELIACALREDLLRRRVAALLVEYRQINVRLAGVAGELRPEGDGPRLTAVGAVLQAIADGLALQAALDPGFDLAGAIAAVEELMSAALGSAAADSPATQSS